MSVQQAADYFMKGATNVQALIDLFKRGMKVQEYHEAQIQQLQQYNQSHRALNSYQ
jgi:hypothetical protein